MLIKFTIAGKLQVVRLTSQITPLQKKKKEETELVDKKTKHFWKRNIKRKLLPAGALACELLPALMLGRVCVFSGPSGTCKACVPSENAGFTKSSGLEAIRGIVEDWI